MEELHKKLLHWMMVERSDRTRPWICFDDGGGGDGGGGDGGGGDGGDGGGDDGDDDDDGQDGGEPSEPAEPDPEANFDFSAQPSLEPGVTVELSAAAQGRGDVEDATIPEPAAPPEPTPPEETPEFTLPEINVVGSQPSEKETQEKEEGPPNAAPSTFGTFNDLASLSQSAQPSVFDLPTGAQPPEKSLDELFNDLSKEPSPAPAPEPSPAPSPPSIFENAINAVTASIMGQAHAATPVSQDIIQQDQVYDPFGTRDEGKEQDRIEPSVPGAVPPEALGKSEALEKEAASKEQDPFDIQNAAFNTFGVNPGFFGAQPVELSTQAALNAVPGMPTSVAAPAPAQQEQTSTPKDDPLNTSMTPTPVSTISVTQTPEQIAAQFGTAPTERAEKKDDDPFGTPEVFNLEMPSAPQAQFDLNTPNPTAPVEVAQAPQAAQAPSPYDPTVFDPTPMNPPSPAPPVEVAQAPLGKSDRENPSTREFDPTIFDPATFAPSAQPAPPVEVAQTPPSQVTSFAPQPGQQPGLPSAVTGVPSGVPGTPSGTPDIGGAGPVVTLPAQRLAVQEVQRQKAIKAKRDAIALAMMRNPNDPMATGGGSLGFNDMLTRS